ncbi:MAG: hypothetical protein ABSG52_15865 [Terriglobales bacterium]|jgi:hypothetical protein
MDERLKRLIADLGAAINDSVSESEQIAEAIATIKAGGYHVSLVLNATIAIKKLEAELVSLPARTNGAIECRFNPQDIKFLKSLHISVNG